MDLRAVGRGGSGGGQRRRETGDDEGLAQDPGAGVVAWLAPFVVAVLIFRLRESARPLFESIMAVAVTGTAVVLGLTYLGRYPGGSARGGLLLGVIWLGICVLIDALLMRVGPMRMTLGEYMADIGFTYVIIPVVTSGLAAARARGAGR